MTEGRRQKAINSRYPRQLLQPSRIFFWRNEKKGGWTTKMNHSANIFFVALWAFLFVSAPGGGNAGDKHRNLINCDLHAGPCTQSLSENTVTLEVTPRPVKAMQDLAFKVTLNGQLPPDMKLPYIDLGMPGMNMGPNRVALKFTGNTTYEGRGVIVKCPSGRQTWRATIIIPDVGQTDFIFDVLY
jgi:hypothetical protein